MNILILHPDYPGQFSRLAPRLVAEGGRVVGVGKGEREAEGLGGVDYRFYRRPTGPPQRLFPPVQAFGEEVRQGRSVGDLLVRLRDEEGFRPDVVLAHPGWGDALFVPEVFPRARLIAYLEYFYAAVGSDLDFDPEFPVPQADLRFVSLGNSAVLHAFAAAWRSLTPTHWQASLFPETMRKNLTVLHEGIDTARLAPRPDASFTLPDGRVLRRGDEVVTFLSRSLEPYRGFHVFMRALPALLRRRPRAQVLIVGDEGVSYGRRPVGGGSWKQALLAEVGADLDPARVHFLGSLSYERYLQFLNVSAVHVYLTYPFVLSWSFLEAMACGCAIVGSATPPVLEVLEEGVNGRAVGFFDRQALVNVIDELLDDPAQRARLGAAARAMAVERYDFATRAYPRYRALIEGEG